MANAEQLSILKQGVEVWNKWRKEHFTDIIDLSYANFREAKLGGANLRGTNLKGVDFWEADLSNAKLRDANLSRAILARTNLRETSLSGANLTAANLSDSFFYGTILSEAEIQNTVFSDIDLREALGLEQMRSYGPSTIGIDTLRKSQGKIPTLFLRGCGLSDWEIEQARLYNPDWSNEEIIQIQYRVYELRATQALQISPLFISYNHSDSQFVDKIDDSLTKRGIRYWRDIHDMKSGRMEKQIDRAIRQNPTVLLVLSENSLASDWVEHEVRTARELEKETGRDALCPVALDDSWKSSRWPKRIMEQIMEYNILDFSEWQDDSQFEGMFRKLIDGLELFYKG